MLCSDIAGSWGIPGDSDLPLLSSHPRTNNEVGLEGPSFTTMLRAINHSQVRKEIQGAKEMAQVKDPIRHRARMQAQVCDSTPRLRSASKMKPLVASASSVYKLDPLVKEK